MGTMVLEHKGKYLAGLATSKKKLNEWPLIIITEVIQVGGGSTLNNTNELHFKGVLLKQREREREREREQAGCPSSEVHRTNKLADWLVEAMKLSDWSPETG